MRREKIQVYDEGFCRLDTWLAKQYNDISRSVLARLIRKGHLRVNRQAVKKASYLVRPGDVLEIHWPAEDCSTPLPERLPLDVIFEDNDIIAVNKRAGMIVHPVTPFQRGTLINALLGHKIKLSRYGLPMRPGIVHRLDKDTSGVLVVAKTDNAYIHLVRQFKERAMGKIYLAVVRGHFKGAQSIESRIGRSRTQPRLMKTLPRGGREALTRVCVLRTGRDHSLLLVQPETGRTHQIRVHLSSQGFPLAGDRDYGGPSHDEYFSRHALHAFSLSLLHPVNGKMYHFSAALPRDMGEFIRDML